MRPEASPYRKAASAIKPGLFRGAILRRRRALVFAFICVCLLWSLPSFASKFGRTLVFFLFSPEWAGPYGKGVGPGGVDILQFVDPLIGTANGGLCLTYFT